MEALRWKKPAARVHDALGLAGGARGVEQVEKLLAVHGLGRADGVGGLHEVVVPVVAARLHVNLVATTSNDDDMLDRGWIRDGDVGLRLEREHVAAAIATV